MLSALVHERVLIDPTHAGSVRTTRRPGASPQPGLGTVAPPRYDSPATRQLETRPKRTERVGLALPYTAATARRACAWSPCRCAYYSLTESITPHRGHHSAIQLGTALAPPFSGPQP